MTDAPCELLEWDTAFWGIKIARVVADSMTHESRAEVDAWCRDNGISCVYFLAGTQDAGTTFAAERGSFFYTDARITLRKEIESRWPEPEVPLRHADDGDLEALQAIARSSHGTTRFYHDPYFSDDRCGDLYAEWIRATYDSGAAVLVIDDDGGRAVAYVTCEIREANTGYIGLIAVEAAMRERRLGTALAIAAHNWMFDAGVTQSAVVTQARNVAALRLIERAGYVVDSTHIWFHKWYDR